LEEGQEVGLLDEDLAPAAGQPDSDMGEPPLLAELVDERARYPGESGGLLGG
jgi:hypothetical protein